VQRLSVLLDRFRRTAGVPAAVGDALEAELEPVFASLEEIEVEASRVREEATADATQRLDEAVAESAWIAAGWKELAERQRAWLTGEVREASEPDPLPFPQSPAMPPSRSTELVVDRSLIATRSRGREFRDEPELDCDGHVVVVEVVRRRSSRRAPGHGGEGQHRRPEYEIERSGDKVAEVSKRWVPHARYLRHRDRRGPEGPSRADPAGGASSRDSTSRYSMLPLGEWRRIFSSVSP
jgi:hypothetical protein